MDVDRDGPPLHSLLDVGHISLKSPLNAKDAAMGPRVVDGPIGVARGWPWLSPR